MICIAASRVPKRLPITSTVMNMEQIGRQAKQIEKERQRQDCAAKEAGDAGDREGGVLGDRDRRSDVPPAKQNEHQCEDETE